FISIGSRNFRVSFPCPIFLYFLAVTAAATATTTTTAATTILFLFRFCLKELFFQSQPFHSFPIIYCILPLLLIYSDRFISPGLFVRTLRLVFL
ncbi:MAG: hypothetical protein EZS28_042938, partial [Streblomastix strix]